MEQCTQVGISPHLGSCVLACSFVGWFLLVVPMVLKTRLIEAETLPNIAQHNHLKHMVFLRWGSEPFEKAFMNTEHIFLVVCFLLYVCVLLSRFSSRNKHDSFNNVHSLVMGPWGLQIFCLLLPCRLAIYFGDSLGGGWVKHRKEQTPQTMSQIIGFIFPKTCEQKHLVLYMEGVVPDTDEFQGFWVNSSQEMMLRKRSFPSWDNPAFTFFLGCYVSFREGLVTSSSSHIFNFPNEDFWPSICCSNKADFFRAFWLVHNFLKGRFRWECLLLLFVRCLLFTLPNLPQCYLHPEWWFKKGWLHSKSSRNKEGRACLPNALSQNLVL